MIFLSFVYSSQTVDLSILATVKSKITTKHENTNYRIQPRLIWSPIKDFFLLDSLAMV